MFDFLKFMVAAAQLYRVAAREGKAAPYYYAKREKFGVAYFSLLVAFDRRAAGLDDLIRHFFEVEQKKP